MAPKASEPPCSPAIAPYLPGVPSVGPEHVTPPLVPVEPASLVAEFGASVAAAQYKGGPRQLLRQLSEIREAISATNSSKSVGVVAGMDLFVFGPRVNIIWRDYRPRSSVVLHSGVDTNNIVPLRLLVY